MYGTSGFGILSLLFLGIVCIGIYLCKYNLKFVSISILASAILSTCLHIEMQTVISLLDAINYAAIILILEYILPIVFFCLFSVIVLRWGMQRNSGELNRQSYELSVQPRSSGLRTRWLEFRLWFTRKENIVLCIIAALIFVNHLIFIDQPSTYMGDERIYVSDANRIIDGRPMAYLEHPPLAKWFIAGGIFIFGNNAVGWRIFPILFGVASIILFYMICQTLVRRSSLFKKITENNKSGDWWEGCCLPSVFIPLLSTFMFASENLSFVQSHMAMLDVFSVTLMLAGFLIYLNQRYLLCGIVFGLSILCKETAVLGLVAIIFHWVIVRRREIFQELRSMWQRLRFRTFRINRSSDILPLAGMLTAVAATWLVLVPLLEYTHSSASGDPFLRIYYIYWHSAVLLAGQTQPGVGLLSHPWQWLIQQYWQNYNFSHTPRYLVTMGFIVWALIIPSIIYLIFKAVKLWKNRADIVIFTLCWFVAVYAPLIVLDLTSNRPMFSFYFYPAVPAVCIAIALLCWDLWQIAQRRAGTKLAFNIVLVTFIISSLASFVILSPLGTNLIKLPF